MLCHSTRIRDDAGRERLVIGPGNSSLNLFGWLDAFQAALLDEQKLTVSEIDRQYQVKFRRPLGPAEKAVTGLWLSQFRATLKAGLPRFDEPFGNGQSREPHAVPTGPGRTQPFRTLVRRVLVRSGGNMSVYTKIAPVYHQDWREWAQVDGSIKDLYVRSSLAALAAGATLDNMRIPEVADNIRRATDFTRSLAGPTLVELFPEASPKPDALDRGKSVYGEHCASCHGRPGTNRSQWVNGERHGQVIPFEEVGTDPERVTFRYNFRLPDALYDHFDRYPLSHPFKFPRDTLRPGPLGKTLGYVCGPIDSVATRAPYLHNASVPTLAELINLKPRAKVFYRGKDLYDKENVGLKSPDQPDARSYFRFDTSLPGNSNAGHDYPWRYEDRDKGWNQARLLDLLEYLKTI